MDWQYADPLGEIDGRIRLIEDDMHAWQHQIEDAHQTKISAQHAADQADAFEVIAREHVRGDVQELEQLHADRALLLPAPRAGA